MISIQIFTGVMSLLVVIALIVVKYLLQSEKQKAILLRQHNELLSNELAQERKLLSDKNIAYVELDKTFCTLQSDYKNLSFRFQELLDNRAKEEERFEHLATKIIEAKTEKFDHQHKEGIKEILQPLKEKLKNFEDKVEFSNKASLERHTSLREQIHMLTQLNEKITKEANNLTRALKSDTKKQGNWGELILESILDKSGLEKGREYHVQKSLIDDEGRRFQPDVIIDIPDGKKMIVDSKVSLVAYEKWINSDNEDEGMLALKMHVKSIRQHIDGLAEKNYHDLYKIESPDFVLMFVPIDTAFSSALSMDQGLYQYAFDKHIVIVTPSTLLATLKTVETMWRNDKQNRYAIDIAVEAGKMYDKFANFVSDLEKLGRQLDTTRGSFEAAMNKLSNGSGNLVRRAEKLKQLGAKTSKSLPVDLVALQD